MNVHAQQQLNKAKSGTVSDVMQFVQWELLGEFQSRKQAVNQWDVGNNGTTVLHYLTSWNPPLPLRICVWLDNRLLFQLPAPIVKSITGWWGGVCVCVSEWACVRVNLVWYIFMHSMPTARQNLHLKLPWDTRQHLLYIPPQPGVDVLPCICAMVISLSSLSTPIHK